MAADPFGRGPRDREQKNPGGSRQSQMVGGQVDQEYSRADVESECCRQSYSRNRHEPPKGGDVDEQSSGDPVEAGEEEAKAKSIAQAKGSSRASAAFFEPKKPDKGDEEQRGHIHRGQRGRRSDPQQKGQSIAPPAR